MSEFFKWFVGGKYHYHTLVQCLDGDGLMIGLVVVLCLVNTAGYLMIANHWKSMENNQLRSPGQEALKSLRKMFILCGTCGYLFLVIKMFLPVWRIWVIPMLFLCYYTYRFLMNVNGLKAVYVSEETIEKLKIEIEAELDEEASLLEIKEKLQKIERVFYDQQQKGKF